MFCVSCFARAKPKPRRRQTPHTLEPVRSIHFHGRSWVFFVVPQQHVRALRVGRQRHSSRLQAAPRPDIFSHNNISDASAIAHVLLSGATPRDRRARTHVGSSPKQLFMAAQNAVRLPPPKHSRCVFHFPHTTECARIAHVTNSTQRSYPAGDESQNSDTSCLSALAWNSILHICLCPVNAIMSLFKSSEAKGAALHLHTHCTHCCPRTLYTFTTHRLVLEALPVVTFHVERGANLSVEQIRTIFKDNAVVPHPLALTCLSGTFHYRTQTPTCARTCNGTTTLDPCAWPMLTFLLCSILSFGQVACRRLLRDDDGERFVRVSTCIDFEIVRES